MLPVSYPTWLTRTKADCAMTAGAHMAAHAAATRPRKTADDVRGGILGLSIHKTGPDQNGHAPSAHGLPRGHYNSPSMHEMSIAASILGTIAAESSRNDAQRLARQYIRRVQRTTGGLDTWRQWIDSVRSVSRTSPM